jgi:DNA-binding HxlR family transcriptional regulator
MRNQPTEGDPVAESERVHCLVLNVVVDKKQRPWSVEEIVRAVDGMCSTLAIEDALSQLQVLGLINRTNELVFPSQAAAHLERLGMFS